MKNSFLFLKRTLTSLIFATAMITLLTHCAKEEITPQNDLINTELPQAAVKQNVLKAGELTGTFSATLYAGQNIQVGTVAVSQVNTDTDPLKPEPDALQVTYTLTGGWVLADANLWIGTTLVDMPRNDPGNPKIGQFPYYKLLGNDQTSYSFVIPFGTSTFMYTPCNPADLMIAAKATVELRTGNNVQSEGAWGGTLPIVVGKNWGTYFIYNLKDETPPTIDCPADASIPSCTKYSKDNVYGTATGHDNCSVSVTYEDALTEGGCDFTYSVKRTWTATDAAGNKASCVQTLTAQDMTPPALISKSDDKQLVSCGITPADTDFDKPVFEDECSGQAEAVKEGEDAVSKDNTTGFTTYTRTWKATDACGNISAAVSQTIKVPICGWSATPTGNPEWKPAAGTGWAYDFVTGTAKSLSLQTNTLDRNGNNWGWTNGKISPDPNKTYKFRLYVCAGRNDLNKGTWVGDVTVTYIGSTVKVIYNITDLCNISVAHIYVGATELPKTKKGIMTAAPGQFPYNSGQLPAGTKSYTRTIEGVKGDIFIAAHAEISLAQ